MLGLPLFDITIISQLCTALKCSRFSSDVASLKIKNKKKTKVKNIPVAGWTSTYMLKILIQYKLSCVYRDSYSLCLFSCSSSLSDGRVSAGAGSSGQTLFLPHPLLVGPTQGRLLLPSRGLPHEDSAICAEGGLLSFLTYVCPLLVLVVLNCGIVEVL